jgi:mRNA interferase RelE/StbE
VSSACFSRLLSTQARCSKKILRQSIRKCRKVGLPLQKNRCCRSGRPSQPSPAVFQVNFSTQAMQELNRLDKIEQLEAIMPISSLKASDLAAPREPLGRFNRAGHVFYRLRAGEFRFYFEVTGDMLLVTYILHKNSLEDFLLRNKLPVSEQQLVEQHSKFWKYLEGLTK